MRQFLVKFLCVFASILSLRFAVCFACNCIRIKDCVPFTRLLLHHRPEERSAIFARVHAAGCGFQGVDPLVCCPRRMLRFTPTDDRWIWDRDSVDETEMHVHNYWDFKEQRNCPQPVEPDFYDQRFGKGDGHHYLYHIDHEAVDWQPRSVPEDKPIVFPGDLRFQADIENRDNAGQDINTVPDEGSGRAIEEHRNLNNCGISVSSRLIGGEQALPGQYPWLARIAYRNRSNSRISYRCSGSLISDTFIVTAAHCVINLVTDLELSHVRLEDADAGFAIAQVLVHPNYDQPKYANDIALLRLNNKAGNFNPICLPLNSSATLAERLVGQTGVAAGWSNTNPESNSTNSSSSVRFIRLPIVNTSSCAAAYASLSENFQQPIVIRSSHLCAQGKPMNDVCRGDSGGPFMDDGNSGLFVTNGRYTLIGIVAFGPTLCGVTTIPGVYTLVSSFMDWILSNINSGAGRMPST